MKILEKIMSYYAINGESVVFDDDGKFIVNKANCLLIDICLALFAAQKTPLSNNEFRVELLKCHIFISYPELNKLLNYMGKEGLITIGNVN